MNMQQEAAVGARLQWPPLSNTAAGTDLGAAALTNNAGTAAGWLPGTGGGSAGAAG